MKMLIWKEFREKRAWALVWAASIVVAFSTSCNFCGGEAFTPWLILPILLSLVVGAAAYSTELKGNRVDFLYSLPIGWTRLLLAKALFGFVIAFGSVALAALVFRVLCPDYYVPFATPGRLAEAMGSVAWWLWTLYLCGLCFSVVLPGVEGGLIVFLMCLLSVLVFDPVWRICVPASAERLFSVGASQAILIGPTIAALMMLRFGLSLPQKSRVIRYGLVVLAIYVAIPALLLMVPKDAFVSAFCKSALCRKGYNWSRVSPGGEYVLAHYRWRFEERIGVFSSDFDLRERNYVVRLSDGRATRLDINLPQCPICVWVNGDTAYCSSGSTPEMRVVRMDGSGNAALSSIKLEGIPTQLLPSADGSSAIVASQGQGGSTLEFLDTVTGKPLVPPVRQACTYWWQSGNQVGYLDAGEKRHMISLR